MRTHHGERGQVLPLWILGGITTLALMFLAVNYANAVRYQIRAQNAADSAAQAIVGLQSQRFNMTNIAMYGANVEEFRLRKSLDGMLLAINASGGCNTEYTAIAPYYISYDVSEGSCNRTYQDLKHEYFQSLNRYTADVNLLNDASANNTYTNWNSDAASLLSQIEKGSSNCGGSTAAIVSASTGDCDLHYTLNGARYRTQLKSVQEDAARILVPALGTTSTIPNDSEAQPIWAPAEADVSTCVKVQPLIPNFGPIHLPVSYAVGRAAAANVMMEQDWMEVGQLNDPQRGINKLFQPFEPYTQSSLVDGNNSALPEDYYNVNFGGNVSYAFPQYNQFEVPTLDKDELSVLTGWWNAIPERPFVGSINTATVCP